MLILFSFLFDQKITCRNSSLKLLFKTQPVCVSYFLPNFSFMFLIDMFLMTNACK